MKINGYELDKDQEKIVKCDKNVLVIAGAGSGKTLTIIGKIKHLLNRIDKDDILCISFTKASSDNLKEKIKKELNIDMNVYTFHKLGLEILKKNNKKYTIAFPDTLDNIIEEFLYVDIINNKKYINYIRKYLGVTDDYYKILDSNEMLVFKKIISTFIKLMKCNGLSIKDFNKIIKKTRYHIFHYRKDKIFLIIILNIYIKYTKYLIENNEIDFDDMIIKSTEEIKKTKLKYKYIIIDEFQDTSYIRFKLIKEIIKYTNANIMVVGDDYQSIYRFTGCDINLFINFKKYIKNTKIMKINNTYRNSQELINIASKFIMKNKNQIRKKLKSKKHIEKPIELIYYDNIEYTFKKIVDKLQNSILVLGRNNKDIDLLNINHKDNKIVYNDKDIKYMTIHKSKGLESDNVIIINLKDDILGFPSKIKEERLFKYIMNYEKYEYAEERRLFYVALTRTKNKVYLLVPKKNESKFVKELKNMI